MTTDERLSHPAELAELQDLVLSTKTLDEFLREVTNCAIRMRHGQMCCGITVRTGHGRPYTVGSTDGVASRLDEAQYAAQDGPCLHALRENMVVVLPRVVDDHRWPTFRSHALQEGLVSSLSVPMVDHQATVGALNLYTRDPNGIEHDDYERATQFAAQAAGAVALATRLAEQQRLTTDLQAALASRTTIDQALGILMGQQHCTATEAFSLLRQASQHRNIKLREVAGGLIEQVSGRPPEPGPTVD